MAFTQVACARVTVPTTRAGSTPITSTSVSVVG